MDFLAHSLHVRLRRYPSVYLFFFCRTMNAMSHLYRPSLQLLLLAARLLVHHQQDHHPHPHLHHPNDLLESHHHQHHHQHQRDQRLHHLVNHQGGGHPRLHHLSLLRHHPEDHVEADSSNANACSFNGNNGTGDICNILMNDEGAFLDCITQKL
jgi:hypothetical protein